jgi:hypothetical protein
MLWQVLEFIEKVWDRKMAQLEWWPAGRMATGRCIAYAGELASVDADYSAEVGYADR